jgi:hypothetical protein
MQTLIFYTTLKRAQLLSGPRGESNTLETFDNVSTVKYQDGFYEVMQKTSEESNSAIPVMRVPVANTNMIIQK